MDLCFSGGLMNCAQLQSRAIKVARNGHFKANEIDRLAKRAGQCVRRCLISRLIEVAVHFIKVAVDRRAVVMTQLNKCAKALKKGVPSIGAEAKASVAEDGR